MVLFFQLYDAVYLGPRCSYFLEDDDATRLQGVGGFRPKIASRFWVSRRCSRAHLEVVWNAFDFSYTGPHTARNLRVCVAVEVLRAGYRARSQYRNNVLRANPSARRSGQPRG